MWFVICNNVSCLTGHADHYNALCADKLVCLKFQLVSLLFATLDAIHFVADWSKFWADSWCIGRNWHRSNDLVEHKKVHDVFFATKLHGWQGMLMSPSISSALSITDLLCHTLSNKICLLCTALSVCSLVIAPNACLTSRPLMLLLPLVLLLHYKLLSFVTALTLQNGLWHTVFLSHIVFSVHSIAPSQWLYTMSLTSPHFMSGVLALRHNQSWLPS